LEYPVEGWMQCSPHQLKKGCPTPLSHRMGAPLFFVLFFVLENDPPSYFIHL
jgi:hypothetical protein